MILLLIGVLALMGGTTWLVLNGSLVHRRALHRRLTATGLILSATVTAAALVIAVVTVP